LEPGRIIKKTQMDNQKTLADRLIEGELAKGKIIDELFDAFEKYEPEIYKKLDDIEIGCDYYDWSVEIYFKDSLPYPYEPCKEIRDMVYNMGFDKVYWNFTKDTRDVICDRYIGEASQVVKNSMDEIRDWEPRHSKHNKWIETKYGYIDERFNEEEWKSKYNFLNK
jgi:hypothetical protein